MDALSNLQGYAGLVASQQADARIKAAADGDGAAADARKAAEAFESYFIEAMLKEMRRTVPRSEDGQGQAMGIFEGMFDSAISERIAQGGGVGLADMIEESLLRAIPSLLGVPTRSGDDFSELVDMGRVSSAFGVRKDPITGAMKHHDGIDIAVPAGTEVRPVRPGQVVFSGVNGGYGQVVVVDHGDGLRSTYAHLRDRGVGVGDKVERDTIVGHVGSSGRSTGPHLHLEITRHGSPVDPADFLEL